MYSVAVIGNSPATHIAALACKAAGFAETKQFASLNESSTDGNSVHCIPASASRIINTLSPTKIESIGLCPDREQVRLGRSAYLLSELPLGKFYLERYGAPLVNCTRKELIELLAQHDAFDPSPAKKSLQELKPTMSWQYCVTQPAWHSRRQKAAWVGSTYTPQTLQKTICCAMPMSRGWVKARLSYKGLANPRPIILSSPIANCHLKSSNGTEAWHLLLPTNASRKRLTPSNT